MHLIGEYTLLIKIYAGEHLMAGETAHNPIIRKNWVSESLCGPHTVKPIQLSEYSLLICFKA